MARFLVVEDEVLVAMLLTDMLEDAGHTVAAHAQTLEQALTAVEADKFDAAILDTNLAGVEVYPVAEALKAKDVPFCFASGYRAEDLPAQWKSHTLLEKPFTAEQLETCIEGCLKQRV